MQIDANEAGVAPIADKKPRESAGLVEILLWVLGAFMVVFGILCGVPAPAESRIVLLGGGVAGGLLMMGMSNALKYLRYLVNANRGGLK